ncbi:hypothetical protein OPQ81_003633 [Rhizoctonia solani]|nr:hypothetical protein OPQ81_003633 [Rhizoctonia solani]
MRRGGGYAETTQRHGKWDDNDNSDYSQHDEVQPPSTRYDRSGYEKSHKITPVCNHRPPSGPKPSGIPRPEGKKLRPPSVMKTSRSLSFSSSSSADSRTINENVPPIPQIQPRSGISDMRDNSYSTGTSHPHDRLQAKVIPSKLKTRPPLPSSNRDGNARAVEEMPKRTSWAKDRRRFANATPTPTAGAFPNKDSDSSSVGSGDDRYDQGLTPVAPARRSSMKLPSNFSNSVTPKKPPPISSRIPSVSTKPAREAPRIQQSLEHGVDSRNTPRANPLIENNGTDQTSSYMEDRKTPQVASRLELSRMQTPNTSRTADPSLPGPVKQLPTELGFSGSTDHSSNRQGSTHPRTSPHGAKRQAEPVIISSRHDAQLPLSPFAQHNAIGDNRTPQQGDFPEPSPNKGTPPANTRSPTEREHPPTILQRLTRRTSLSTAKSSKTSSAPKSPNPSSTPKNWLGTQHDVDDLPFNRELETPRATISAGGNAGAKSVTSHAPQGLTDRNRQTVIYQPTVYSGSSENESIARKPRSKVIEGISRDSEERLGSPFMGDGSPRFGIDERFRSPNKRTKSGLQHNTFESNDDRSQELLEYYGHGIVEPVNTANYYIEGLPIGTVLSSPRDTPVAHTPKGMMPSSPMIQSKRRSQYPYTSRIRSGGGGSSTKQKGPRNSAKPSDDDSDGSTPTVAPRFPNPSFGPPPIITRTSVTSLDTSTRSEFCDFSEQESDQQGLLTADGYREGAESGKGYSEHRTPTLVRFASQIMQHEPDQQASRSENPPSVCTGNAKLKSEVSSVKITTGQYGNKSSQLPVLRQRKTNSALFRALEQPYDSSSSGTVASLGSSIASGGSNSSSEGDLRLRLMLHRLMGAYTAKTNSDYEAARASVEGLHAVSSITSSLDGNGVGDIRWSGAQELSGAAEALFHSIEQSHTEKGVKSIAMDSNDESQSSIIDGSTYDVDEETDDGNYGSRQNSPLRNSDRHRQENDGKQRRMSIQDKRKAIHGSWRASLEEGQLQRLEESYDPMEMHRQELIWEFHESEKAFVDTLRVLVQLFIQPLRTQDQKNWIAGLSPDIMRLFDWLDDISNLHEQLLDALEVMQQDHDQVIILFSENIQPFVSLMELYQPYIVRVEETSKKITSMVLDPQNDFGEFVRIQSALPECELGLEEMTKRPLSRLREYVTVFQTLLTLTPRTHPDYLSCFSLFHSMHAMVRVLDEVKAREEEYELIKSLLARVRGLPSQFMVAARENRLLAQGPLNRVYVHGDGKPGEKATPVSRKSGVFVPRGSRGRSCSQSTAALSTTCSTTSYPSTSSSATRLKNSSIEYSMRSDSSATSGANIPQDDRRKSKPTIMAHSQNPGSRTPGLRPRTPSTGQAEEVEIYALVFTDHIILTRGVMGIYESQSPWSHSDERWTMFESLGIFRLLGVVDYHGRYGYDYLVSLDLVPIGDTSLSDTDTPVFVDIPYRTQQVPGDTQDLHKTRQQWLQSLQQCYLHTLRSISFPSQSEDIPSNITQRGSPLPTEDRFPKSPSEQLDRRARCKEARASPITSAEEEREEREFWAERFKIISNEMRKVYDGSGGSARQTPSFEPAIQYSLTASRG